MSSDEHVILIAFEVEAPTRGEARALAYSQMPIGHRVVGSKGVITGWWHADPDHTDHHDNREAVFVHHGRALEAGKRLHELGLTGEASLRLGEHPSVTEWGDADATLSYQCDHCTNEATSPAALVAVPCVDLHLPEHDHLWVVRVEHEATGAIGVECRGCDLVIDEDEALHYRRPTYVVLDQNGGALFASTSWALASAEARQYGAQASVYDRSERKMQIIGRSDDDPT